MSHDYFFCVSVLITGCGEEDITEPEEEMVELQEEINEPEDPCMQEGPPDGGLPLNITPAPGTTISSSQEFTLMFDPVVTEVIVNGIAATDTKASGVGLVWVVSLILEPGARAIDVEWTKPDGCPGARVFGPYTVVADEE